MRPRFRRASARLRARFGSWCGYSVPRRDGYRMQMLRPRRRGHPRIRRESPLEYLAMTLLLLGAGYGLLFCYIHHV